MFECIVFVELPIYPGDNEEIESYRIASFSFDPGLQLGEEVQVDEASFFLNSLPASGRRVRGQEARFSFRAIVKEKLKLIQPDAQGENGVTDKLVLQIVLEIADKENLPEISRIMRGHNSNE